MLTVCPSVVVVCKLLCVPPWRTNARNARTVNTLCPAADRMSAFPLPSPCATPSYCPLALALCA
jgi:hypothetical protein